MDLLLEQYEELFPSNVFKVHGNLEKYIEKYCHAEGCPICGEPMVGRTSKRGAFLGCSNYPICQGARDKNGKVSKNEFLRIFLADKAHKELQSKSTDPPRESKKRWRHLKKALDSGD